jgi:NADPH2:quinone reductase
VLVTGGAGAVGHAAIQLAEWAGATVITTISGDRKAEPARLAGAHTVINLWTDDVVTVRPYGFLRQLDGSFASDDHAQKKI